MKNQTEAPVQDATREGEEMAHLFTSWTFEDDEELDEALHHMPRREAKTEECLP